LLKVLKIEEFLEKKSKNERRDFARENSFLQELAPNRCFLIRDFGIILFDFSKIEKLYGRKDPFSAVIQTDPDCFRMSCFCCGVLVLPPRIPSLAKTIFFVEKPAGNQKINRPNILNRERGITPLIFFKFADFRFFCKINSLILIFFDDF